MAIERPAGPPPSPRQAAADFDHTYGAIAVVAFLFAASGPLAIILSVGTRGGLGASDLASWIFGAFSINGLLSIVFSWLYRQPLVFFWTIPGTVLVGPALAHATFPEVIGAFLATGALMLALGLSGWVSKAIEAVPMPIVMGMVSGVFLRFGLDLVYAMRDRFWIAAPMTAVFLALSATPALSRRLPPLIAALVVGTLMVVLTEGPAPMGAMSLEIARPTVYVPAWSWRTLVELVVPLAITVLVVQNTQGITVLRAAGHRPPIDAIAAACGAVSVLTALVGSVSTCLTGPVNAILASTGQPRRQYTAAIGVGVLGVGFGLLAPTVTRLMLATPPAFIGALAGLAMLRVLQGAFTTAFRGRCTLGALVAFVVTVADVAIANVGAPFWGLVLGFAVSWLLERADLEAGRP
jgi:benzoate membrane transport protein